MKNGLLFLSILLLTYSCRKTQDHPALPVNQEVAGYWNVTEDVYPFWDSTLYSHDNFIGETRTETDSTFSINQTRNTYLYPWAGWSASTIYLKRLPDGVLFHEYQGSVGKYSGNFDSLTLKYVYGAGNTVYNVYQRWIRNRSITIDSLRDGNAYLSPYTNDSLSSIIVAAGNKMYNIGDTGRLIWSFQHDDYQSNDHCFVDNNNVYFSMPNIAGFYAVDLTSGHLNYRFSHGPGSNTYDYPFVVNGKLMINVSGVIKQFNAASGTVITEKLIPSLDPINLGKPLYLNGQTTYIGNEYNFVAYDINADTIRWQTQPFRLFSGTKHFTSMPVSFKNSVFLAFDDGSLLALDGSNGTVKWRNKVSTGTRIGHPVVGNDLMYFGSNDHKMYAVFISTGSKNWEFTSGYEINSTPFFLDDVLYFGSTDGKVYALDSKTGNKIWSYATKNAVFSSPAVLNNVLYIGSSDGNLYALDIKTGKKIWSANLGSPVSSPVIITKANRRVSAFITR